ncbi:MAG: hypothetical protein QGH37_25440 [Candidatus Poribacteria bacterium]|nr:hypothetical protein [Candidatus Poribacteria bacterium]
MNREHGITIFEKNDYIGGHTHSAAQKRSLSIQGSSFTTKWPIQNFINFLDQLLVERQKTPMFLRMLWDILRWISASRKL